jgi:hypothetical protein
VIAGTFAERFFAKEKPFVTKADILRLTHLSACAG